MSTLTDFLLARIAEDEAAARAAIADDEPGDGGFEADALRSLRIAESAAILHYVARIGDMLYAVSDGSMGFGVRPIGGDFQVIGPGFDVVGPEFDLHGGPGDVRGDGFVIERHDDFDLLPDDAGQDLPVTVPDPVF